MKNDRSWTFRHAAAAALVAASLLGAAATGCKSLGLPENRLMSCKTDDDCKAADPKRPACANLRCVECAYDTDCGEGGACSNNRCQKLFTSPGDSGPEEPPKNLDACLSRCQDQACFDKCNDQFRPVEPAPK